MRRPVTFYAPAIKRYETDEFQQSAANRMIGVSVTGSRCALNCPHCEGSLLKHMATMKDGENLFDLLKRLKTNGVGAALISGGSDRNGKVPLMPHVEHMRRAKDELGYKLSVHTGLIDRNEAIALKAAGVDTAMIDIIGDAATIRGVYHLSATPEDFEQSLSALCDAGLAVSPHIVIGLNYGKIIGESAALDIVAKYPVRALILVVITPLHGTAMENVEPPRIEKIKELFVEARNKMGSRQVILGCARPMGLMRKAIDEAAIDAGLDGIAYPSADVAASFARDKNLGARYVEKCCAMI